MPIPVPVSPDLPYIRRLEFSDSVQVLSPFGVWSSDWVWLGWCVGYTAEDALSRWNSTEANPLAKRAFDCAKTRRFRNKFD